MKRVDSVAKPIILSSLCSGYRFFLSRALTNTHKKKHSWNCHMQHQITLPPLSRVCAHCAYSSRCSRILIRTLHTIHQHLSRGITNPVRLRLRVCVCFVCFVCVSVLSTWEACARARACTLCSIAHTLGVRRTPIGSTRTARDVALSVWLHVCPVHTYPYTQIVRTYVHYAEFCWRRRTQNMVTIGTNMTFRARKLHQEFGILAQICT